jgi:glycosyltransferase involved in cell wall biosynthesis
MTNKIAVNGRCFSRRITGVERYAHEISKRMEPNPRIIAPGNMLGQISGHLWEQFILPAQLHNDRLLWSPANTGPWAINSQAVTIHDASVFDHPEWFSPSFASWTRLSWKILAKQAKAIITVSSFSRERLKYRLKISDEKIHIIPNGVGKPFELQPQKTIEVVKEKYGLTRPYFLFVGTVEPRKNLPNLFRAWEQAEINNHILVIAGTKGIVFAEANGPHVKSDTIKWLGYVPEPDLPALYAGATTVIVPSFYEGFGLTALEAMACSTPVVASNTTAFPETTGNAALLVDPRNSNELSDAMKNIMENKKLANTLRERGLQQAAQFTWEESACRTQSLLEGLR